MKNKLVSNLFLQIINLCRYAAAQEDEEKERIAAYRASLSPEDIERVVAETEELKRLQAGVCHSLPTPGRLFSDWLHGPKP